ncbi:MAG: right-handed parallel beta-helix repeat-containing protein, partial [Planctomycetota bacterium]
MSKTSPRAAWLYLPLLIAAVSFAHSADPITEDTTWSGDVEIEGPLEVQEGATLSIDPGTTVSMSDNTTITVRGRLLADGTEESPIRFTRSENTDTWERILLIGADGSRFRHCIVEYSDCEGDHKDYYDDRDEDCEFISEGRDPRDYNEAIVAIASDVEFTGCTFQNLPQASNGEGDAIAIISDDPQFPGESTAHIDSCTFQSIGQGIHTRYAYVLVEDCYFNDHNGDNDDVDLYGESDPPPLIRNNLFIEPDDDDMINPTRCSAILEGNIISGSGDHGIVLRDRCDPILINNLIYDCSSAGIAVQNTCNATLINNTIADCRRGVRFFDHTGRWDRPYCLDPGSGRATLINCVIWDCDEPLELSDTSFDGDPGSHVIVDHCAIVNGQDDFDIDPESTVTWLDGNVTITEDPFVDADAGDFQLVEGSPLVNAGKNEDAPAEDFDGNKRPCGGTVDIGAYEYGDCDDPPPPVDPQFVRGDTNGDGLGDISDPVALLLHLFAGREPPSCMKSADANDSGVLDLSDAIYFLN